MAVYASMKNIPKKETYRKTTLPTRKEIEEFNENILNSPFDSRSLIENATEILQMDLSGHNLGGLLGWNLRITKLRYL